MKKSVLIGFVVFILTFMLLSCGGGGGDDFFNIPASAADIANFNSSSGYTPISQAKFDEFYDEFFPELQDLLDELVRELNDELGYLFSSTIYRSLNARSTYARVTQADRILLNDFFKEEFALDFTRIPNADLTGFVDYNITYKSEEDLFPASGNGTVEFRLEMSEGFTSSSIDDDLEEFEIEVIGVLAGRGNANNIRITSEEDFSGSLSGSLNAAVNIGIKEEGEKLSVKIISTSSVTSNLNSSNPTISGNATIRYYGANDALLKTNTFTFTVTKDRATYTLN